MFGSPFFKPRPDVLLFISLLFAYEALLLSLAVSAFLLGNFGFLPFARRYLANLS